MTEQESIYGRKFSMRILNEEIVMQYTTKYQSSVEKILLAADEIGLTDLKIFI